MAHSDIGRVLVTGGSSGLGAAIAHAVADAGGTPVVLDVNEPPFPVEFARVDLSDAAATTAAVQRVAEDGLSAVVTAAGIDACGALEDVPVDEWERVIRVNLLGTVAVVRAALPTLAANQGRVVTIASTQRRPRNSAARSRSLTYGRSGPFSRRTDASSLSSTTR